MKTPTTFSELVVMITGFISLLVPIIIAITFIYIAWKILQAWVIGGGDKTSVDEGKKVALVGVIALAFMFGIWGLLALLQSSFGL